MTTSIWGVEHGIEISKKRNKFNSHEKQAGAASLLGTPMSGALVGSRAKKGKGVKAGMNAFGRGTAEAVGGGAVGMAAAGALTRGRSQGAMQAGNAVGGIAGGVHGTMASARNSRRKGWMKKVR